MYEKIVFIQFKSVLIQFEQNGINTYKRNCINNSQKQPFFQASKVNCPCRNFLISSWVLVGPEQNFLIQKKLVGALSAPDQNFYQARKNLQRLCQVPEMNSLIRLSMENLFVSGGALTRESLHVIFVVKVRSIRYKITFILHSH